MDGGIHNEAGRDHGILHVMDVELARHAADGEKVDFYLIGRSALVLRFGLELATTRDVDIVHVHGSGLELKAVELFGKGTSLAARLGLYLEPVPQGLPPIPGGYFRQSVDIGGNWQVIRPKQPELNDLAVTKLKRFHAKDRQDLQILCDSAELDSVMLRKALESAFAWADKDDPDRDRAVANLRRVIAYLEGKTLAF